MVNGIFQGRKTPRRFFSLVVFGFVFLWISAASAQTDSEIKAENEQLRSQAKEIQERENSVKQRISTDQVNLEALTSQLEELEVSTARLSNKISVETARLNSAEREIASIKSQAVEQTAEADKLRSEIEAKAIAGYQIGEAGKASSTDPTELVRMTELLASATETEIEDIRNLDNIMARLAEEEELAGILKRRVENSKKALEADKAELDAERAQQQALVDQAEAALEARLAEAAVLAERDSELASRISANTSELAARVARRTGSGSAISFDSPSPNDIVTVQGIRVHVSIADNFRRLMNAAAADGVNLGGWGYRDNARQIELRRKHCGSSDYAIYRMRSSACSPPTARPGASQHERGLAIDFTYNGGSIGTRYNSGYRWLAANAATYGFFNLPSEPWHWSTTGN